jgi:hypothetical protein
MSETYICANGETHSLDAANVECLYCLITHLHAELKLWKDDRSKEIQSLREELSKARLDHGLQEISLESNIARLKSCEAALEERDTQLQAENKDLLAACEQKQEIINSLDVVDKARNAENAKLQAHITKLQAELQQRIEQRDNVGKICAEEAVKNAKLRVDLETSIAYGKEQKRKRLLYRAELDRYKWIPVSTNPPSTIGDAYYSETRYLVVSGSYVTTRYWREGQTMKYWANWSDERVTHWMPLPSPPQSEGK